MSASRQQPLPPEVVMILSRRMLLLGDPTRIRILGELHDGERNVQSIADALATTQQNVSGHLRVLRAATIVSRRSAGRETFYAVSDVTVFEIWDCALSGLGG